MINHAILDGKEKCCCRYDLLTDATALLPSFLFCPFTHQILFKFILGGKVYPL